jgi:hypothetical protein
MNRIQFVETFIREDAERFIETCARTIPRWDGMGTNPLPMPGEVPPDGVIRRR